MKTLVTITGAPATKAMVTKEVVKQLAKAAAIYATNYVIIRGTLRALIR